VIIQYYIVHNRKNTFSGKTKFCCRIVPLRFIFNKACETHNVEHQRDSLLKYLLQFVIETKTGISLTLIRPFISRDPTFHWIALRYVITNRNREWLLNNFVDWVKYNLLQDYIVPIISPSRLQHRPGIWIVIHHIYLLYTSLHTLQTIFRYL
jgi:hypothetical protein